jgi:hypothetical protein
VAAAAAGGARSAVANRTTAMNRDRAADMVPPLAIR